MKRPSLCAKIIAMKLQDLFQIPEVDRLRILKRQTTNWPQIQTRKV